MLLLEQPAGAFVKPGFATNSQRGSTKCQSSLHQDSIHTWKAFQIDAGKDTFSVGYSKEYWLILLLPA